MSRRHDPFANLPWTIASVVVFIICIAVAVKG